MAKYQCGKCKKVFQYTAKQTHFLEPKDIQIDEDTSVKAGDTLESAVCPYCHSLDFSEFVEPVVVADVLEDMLAVPFEQVKEYLTKGYKELNRTSAVYAKGVVMLKTKPKIEVVVAPKTPEETV
jgi:hypothetical protein